MPSFVLAALLLVLAPAFNAAAQVAVNPVTNRVYVANQADDTVTVHRWRDWFRHRHRPGRRWSVLHRGQSGYQPGLREQRQRRLRCR